MSTLYLYLNDSKINCIEDEEKLENLHTDTAEEIDDGNNDLDETNICLMRCDEIKRVYFLIHVDGCDEILKKQFIMTVWTVVLKLTQK